LSERAVLAEAAQRIIAAHWPGKAGARLSDAWAGMARDGLAAVGSDPDLGGLIAAVDVARALGAAACAVPFPSALAAGLLDPAASPSEEPLALLWGDFDGDRSAAAPLYRDGRLTGRGGPGEDPCDAKQLIVIVRGGFCRCRSDATDVLREALPGLTGPALARFSFEGVPADHVAVDADDIARAASATRLVLAARAQGAAQHAFSLAIDHVRTRRQFGQPLAKFQAMQMKLADCHVANDAASAMIDAAASSFDSGSSDHGVRIDSAIAFAAHHLRTAMFEIQHAFGAIGFAEEHIVPSLFRIVHSDLAVMGGIGRARSALAASLLDSDRHTLPEHPLGEAAEAVRAELRGWLSDNWTEADRAETRAKPFHLRNRDAAFSQRIGEAGWLKAGWPSAFSGAGLSPLAQLAIVEELTRADAPISGHVAAAWLIAPELMRHGSPALQAALLPGIGAGTISFALGYSEPEAGSDLSALRTRAVRDGDGYRITGQKLWGTGTEFATHIVVAARTDPEAKPKRNGISVFVVPADSPGITIQPGMALYGHTFCTQFFDDVFVPESMRLGPENDGWAVLTGALAAERIQLGGNVVRLRSALEQLCATLAQDLHRSSDPLVRDTIGALAADIETARLLSRRSVDVLEAGGLPLVEGAITKVFSGALAERFAVTAMDLFGTAALAGEDTPGAPMNGQLEWLLRQSVMMVIGGGAAEIQKGIIAVRGLDLLAD